jgi:diguanylate cyclase (GGDEF)-like protein/PAS domain S-box-containing protein/putative nucleotidyltransferase with HDIG domain
MEDSQQINLETTLTKLRKVEFQQKAILDNIPDIAWLKDAQGKFIAVNEHFAKACGFKADEIIGKTDLDIWPKELALSYRADDQEIIASKKRKCVQERLVYQEGGEKWIETIKAPFFDDQGKVIGTTGIARDISLHKSETERLKEIRAELELRVKVRTSELASFNEALRKEMRLAQEAQAGLTSLGNFLTNVFNSIQDGLCITDTKKNILRVNPIMEKWYAHSMPLVGKKCYQAFHQRSEPCDICPVEETLKTHKSAQHIVPMIGRDKKTTGYFDLYSFPMFDENTKELVGVIEYVRNITEQKTAQEALRISEEKFRTIADFTYDWEYWQGVDKRMIYVSGSCERITGYTKNDFLSDPDLIEKIVHPDDIEILRKKVNEAVKNSTKLEADFRIINRNGQVCWVSHIGVPVYSEEGNLLGRRASNRDVSKNKEYENELKVYRENLEVLVDQRTQLLKLEIVSRKEVEEKAKILHQQLEFTLGVTKTGLDIIDQDFNLRYVDPAWARNYGDWTGKKCFEYFMGRKSSCPVCAIEEAFRTKKIVVSEEILAKEGNRPIQVTTIPYQDKNGDWLVAEVNVDISQKKQVGEELQRYRNHLEQLVEERTQDLLQETARYRNSEFEKSKLNRELLKTNEKLKSISLIDAHTGLYNYRYLQEAIEVEFHQARRYAQNLAIIMLDIDYFKSINDVYGIAFGDLVLKQLAKQLKRMVRRYDILVRYSGEEFIIISPRLNRNTALNLAQRLLDSLNFINFGNKKHSVKLKMSLSVISFPEDRAKNGTDLINLADLLLNKVKERGGNRACSSLDVRNPLSKGVEKTAKAVGIKTLKNTINKLNKQSKQGLSESIFAFAKTLELKDHYTGEHVENTVHFATEVARELNLAKEDVELIKQAAMLHDLGKIGISENILLKKGKLNKKEFEEIKRHPQIGADIIRPIQFLHDLIPFIFYHHERWDGKGYPSGIKGEDIPLGARVIAIADVYQALISDRPYHKAFTKTAAIDIIKKSSGTQFDPRIVSAFLRVVGKKK